MNSLLELDQKCINTIKLLACDMVQKAKSGHPGAPIGCSTMAHTLWKYMMNYSSSNPTWINRDYFILSNGHACALQYIMLYLSGYDITLDDLKNFRQLGSKTAGHPEKGSIKGIEVTTGPLGQGIANGVGLAIAYKHLAERFNTKEFNIFNNNIYVMCGDGCLMEGISYEAISLAGHLKLNNLILLFDDNGITIDGSTNLAFSEDIEGRFKSCGWNVITSRNTVSDCILAITNAKRSDKPSIIRVKTIIGEGSVKEGTSKVHGAPLGDEDITQLKSKLGFDNTQFQVPNEVLEYYNDTIKKGDILYNNYDGMLDKYKSLYPDKYSELQNMNTILVDKDYFPNFTNKDPMATRKCSHVILNHISSNITQLIGGSADLTPSNLTSIDKPMTQSDYTGRYIHYGIREHAMAGIANGLSASNLLIPYVGTFLNFIQYCLPSVRLSALSGHKVIYVMTHDSVWLGEDGPTHQSVENFAICRSIPNLLTFRPADGNETSGAYKCALETNGPSVICLSRQSLPQITDSMENVSRGAYVLKTELDELKLIIIATGSEVSLCYEAIKSHNNIRLVSMPCMELFDIQSEEYKQEILTPNVPVLSIEASSSFGWQKYAQHHISIDEFGASGKLKDLQEHYGFTTENISNTIKKII